MIVPGAPALNSVEKESIRAPKLLKEPRVPQLGIGTGPKIPRYESFRRPRSVSGQGKNLS